MKNTILSLLALCMLGTCAAPSYAVDTDKKLHFGVSTIMGGLAQEYTEDPLISMSACLAVGLAKEAYDEYSYGGFSKGDMIANGIGCTFGVMGVSILQGYNDDDAVGVGVKIPL